jgi:hypothetical protein
MRLPAGRHDRSLLPWCWAWLALLPIALTRAGLLVESDTFWQTRTGLTILATGRIPATDPYSWTAAGRTWRPNSWAFDALLGLGYPAGGLTVVALIGAVLVLVVGAAVLTLAGQLGAPPVVAATATLIGFAVLIGWLSDRPQLTDYAAVPLLLVLFRVARSGPGRRRYLLAIAGTGAVQAVWVNLHSAAPLGIAVLLAAGVGDAAGCWRTGRRAVLWSTAGLVGMASVATLANPYGVAVFGQALRVHTASVRILEWEPVHWSHPDQLILCGLIVAAAVVVARAGALDLLAVLGLLGLAGLVAVRFLPIGAVVGIAALAGAAGRPAVTTWLAARQGLVRVALATLVGAFGVVAVLGATHLGRPRYPVEAIRALPHGCRLVNSYLLGGPVILLRPDVPVSLDSRTDLYGAAEIAAQQRLLLGRDGVAPLRRSGVTCVLIEPGTGLAVRLRHDPDWRVAVDEPGGVLFIRH